MSEQDKNTGGVQIDEALNLLEGQDTEALLQQHQQQLAQMNEATAPQERYALLLDIASDLLALQRQQDAWDGARACFDFFLKDQDWQHAVEACSVMFQCEMDDSLIALAHGIWLSVTFPIEPATSVAMLQHVIDETPNDSDGAAVAAISAHYIVGMRCEGEKAGSLGFLTTQMIAHVAKRHSQVSDQDMLDFWLERMELKDPAIFLPKLAMVIEALVNGQWWFDRDALRKLIPDN